MRALRLAAALLASGSLAATAAAAPSQPGAAARVPLTVGPTEVVATFPISAEGAQPPNPVATTDDTGVVTAAWSQQAGLHVAQRMLDGAWTAPTTLDTCVKPEPYCSIGSYTVAADGAGTVTAVWSKPTDQLAQYSVSTAALPRGGAWSAPEILHLGRYASPTLAVAHDGSMLLTLETRIRGKGPAVIALYRAPGVSWSAARRRVFVRSQQPATGISDRGVAVLLVRGLKGRASTQLRGYRFRPSVGWSRPRIVAESIPYDIAPFAFTVGRSGRALVAWMAGHELEPVLRARTMNRRGTWGPARTLSRPAAFQPETEGVAIQQSAYVVWTTPHHAIRYAVKAPGKGWKRGIAYPRNTGSARALDINARGDLAIVVQRWPAPDTEMDVGLDAAATGWSELTRVPWTPDDFTIHGSVTIGTDGSALVLSSETPGSPPSDYRVVAWKVNKAQ